MTAHSHRSPPRTLEEQREVLDLFVESAGELVNSEFISQGRREGVATHAKWTAGGFLQVERTGPDHEALKAFLLTVRRFRQNNDDTSLCNMQHMIEAMPVAQDLKQRFTTFREQFNQFLDGPPSISFPVEACVKTRRDVFETFLYGTFAHADRKYRRVVKSWENQPYYQDLRVQFDLILIEFVKALCLCREVCKAMRDEVSR